MKKLFNHTKKPVEDWKGYDENDYDWDDADYENFEEYDESDYDEDIEEEDYYMEEQPKEAAAHSEAGHYGRMEYADGAEDYEDTAYSEEMDYPEEVGVYGEPEYSEEADHAGEGVAYGEADYAGEDVVYIEPEYSGEADYVGEDVVCIEPEYSEEADYVGENVAYGEPEYSGEADYAGEDVVYIEPEYSGEADYAGEDVVYIEPEYSGEDDYAGEDVVYIEPEYSEEADYAGEGGTYDKAECYEETEYAEEAESYIEADYAAEAGDYNGQEYYEEAAYNERQEYYTEDQFEESGFHKSSKKKSRSNKGFLYKLQQGMGAMSGMDKMILGTGVAVLILALVTGSLYVSAKIVDKQVADFASVGSQLEGIDTIGGQGLLAVADAEIARRAAMEAIQEQETEQPKEYQEAEYGRNITVSLNLTSVQKDLKIKFINQANGKLISNVPFTVTVTGPDGKSVVWSDDDMDGIIYKKDITPGTYTVVMESLSDEKYSDYNMPETSQKVEVKKDIDYKKVDVSNEIKKESEINAAKEDTKQNITVVESSLPDTVEWPESKIIDATYNEVSKSVIPDPVIAVTTGTLTTVSETTTTVSGPNPSLTLQGILLDKSEVTVLSTAAVTVTATLVGAVAPAPVVTAVSADAGIAVVSVSGTTVTVTGVNAGSTAVTVSYTENGQTVAGNFSVTVQSHPREDRVTKLKDANGNQLYVLENGAYREAVYADYYTSEKFFVKGNAKYSGWQTLDGKVYYFNANGEKVTGEQVIQGAKYNFASDGSLVTGSGDMGIDVSKWNGNIDWTAVSNSGVSYVIIRCGYRGSSQGKLIEDPKFTANIQGATAAGLKVGVYFFTQAVDEVEAVEEASMVLEQIRGYKISYPVFLDVEPGLEGVRIPLTEPPGRQCAGRFARQYRDAGYTAGVYANKTWLTGKLNAGELSAYKIWAAQYAASPTYTGKYDLWQYKSTGSISGIKGNVDMNLSYLGY